MTPKENLLRAIHRDHPRWVPDGMESVVWIRPPVVERPATAGIDAFGVPWLFEESVEGGTYPAADRATLATLDTWRDRVVIPDPAAMDWSAVRAEGKAIDRERHLVQGFVEIGLFERSYLLLGMEGALLGYLAHPEEMDALVGAIADYKIALVERFDEAGGLDLVWYGDDWGSQDNLLIPPDVWRRVIRPHTQRVYDCMKKRGLLINQHSCGMIAPILGDIVEMGADIWNPCQPCNGLASLKTQHGAGICFCGGIDSQFVLDRPAVTPGEVHAEVRRRIDELAPGGGYIAEPSHAVAYRPEVMKAMHDEIRAYGAWYYSTSGLG